MHTKLLWAEVHEQGFACNYVHILVADSVVVMPTGHLIEVFLDKVVIHIE